MLPRHFFEGRDFARPLTDAPIGSGPYRVTQFELGRSVVYERRPDWWAANLPTAVGIGARGEIDLFGDWVGFEVGKEPLFDPAGERIKG